MRITNKMWDEIATRNGWSVERIAEEQEKRRIEKALFAESVKAKAPDVYKAVQEHKAATKTATQLNNEFSDNYCLYLDAVAGMDDVSNVGGIAAHMDAVLYMFFVMESSQVKQICKRNSKRVEHAISWEDIYQEITLRIVSKPSMVDEIGFFHARVQQLASNAIRGVIREYRRFNPTRLDGKIVESHLAKSAQAFEKFSALMIDIQNTLTIEEYQVFKLFYVDDLPMLDVDKLIGKRCDRIKNKVHAKVEALLSECAHNDIELPEVERDTLYIAERVVKVIRTITEKGRAASKPDIRIEQVYGLGC